jgi:hypothetical protein
MQVWKALPEKGRLMLLKMVRLTADARAILAREKELSRKVALTTKPKT